MTAMVSWSGDLGILFVGLDGLLGLIVNEGD